ncbi:ABC transporter permease [Oceanobacillus jeddahense]|uniref:ABC transporter permease n=1 Tax=Oceanobacillus jeddahense TaxID=1462527 RepID=A0ABY5JYM6_9BACI|nr:ABC transporter permease [Oceanobacillus jeddahense]UUI03624.1 ABC transporter permease [Oceanobacillus jeddahense]
MIQTIAKSYILETVRNSGVFLGNVLTPIILIACSALVNVFLDHRPETVEFMIKELFLPFSIVLLLFSFSFNSATIYLAQLKANKTFHWLTKTNVSPFTYFLGMGIGVFILMNGFLIFILSGFAFLVSISISVFFTILLTCNIIFLAMYPGTFIVAGIVKNGEKAQTWLLPIMMILIFSIYMPSVFLPVSGINPQDYYIFLSWNPMLYFFDILHVQLNVIDHTWLNLYQYALILIGLSILLSILAKKIYNR